MAATPSAPPDVIVLIIEDNQDHALFLSHLLSTSSYPKYEVIEASTLREGLELLKSAEPHLVMLDLSLPDSQGLETFERLSAEATDIPIVVLSGITDVSIAIQTLQKGAQDYLVKGHVDNELLLRSLHYSLERKRTQLALTNAMEELELRVRERTRQLSEVNERLQREVRERKKAEEQTLESNRELVAALGELRGMQSDLVRRERFQALAQMANGIAHDFNNVLTPIVGFAEQLLRDPAIKGAPPHLRDGLQKIKDAALSGSKAVARVRDFARAEAGKMGPVSVSDLIDKALTLSEPMWRNEALAAGITISIEQLANNVPDVLGDEAQLRETVAHLVFNAVRAIHQRGVIRVGGKARGNMVEIFVQDNGGGMSDAQREHCLDARSNAGALAHRVRGYAVIHQILARHHGTLEIESSQGQGTKVTLVLPAAPKCLVEDSMPTEAPVAVPPGMRVLVADDEPMVREVIRLFLCEAGHTAELAEDGASALAKFRCGSYDLVLTDRAMPEMSGDQLAAAIKAINASTPVILLTGFGDAMHADGELPKGVDVVVAKPFTMKSLCAAFEEVARKCKRAEAKRGAVLQKSASELA